MACQPNQVINFSDESGILDTIEYTPYSPEIEIEIESKEDAESKKKVEALKNVPISEHGEIPKSITSTEYVLFQKNQKALCNTTLSLLNKMLIKNPHVNTLVLIIEATPSNSRDWKNDAWYNCIPNLIANTSIVKLTLKHQNPKEFSEL